MRIPIALNKATRLLNHGPVTLVSAAAGGKSNVMAAAWVMPLDFDPPKLAVVLAEGTLTRALVDQSRELVVQVPPRRMLAAVDGVGSLSGRDVDKWARFHLLQMPAGRVAAPLIDGCVAWLECRCLEEESMEKRHDLFVCEVIAAWADDCVFDADGRMKTPVPEDLRSLHHISGGTYIVDGEQLRAR